MDTDIWRNDESRQKNVNKIMDTLQRHMPQTGPDGMNELKKIALGFEDKIYTHATSQIDYLRRISLKMLSLESKASQPSFSGSSSSNNQRPLDAAQQSTLQQTYRSALHHQQQHQQQLQQRLGQQNNVSNMQQQQNQLQQLLQSKHQQTQQTSPSSLLQSQSQQLQQLSQQQQLFSELQSQSQPLQQQQPLLHQSNPTQQELQQSSIEQQNQLLQQRGLSEASSTSMESSDQPGQSTVADCQEKVYQRLQNLKDMYYPEIKEILTKLQLKCQQPMAPNKLEKLQHYINTLQRMIKYFQVQKSRGFKEDKIDAFEKQIQAILNSFKQRKSAPQQLPNQIVSQVQSMQLREEQS